MAAFILLKFLTLKWAISRTIWRIKVSDGSFFFIFHALSFELNFFFDRSFPLIVPWRIFRICRKLLSSARRNMWELLGDRVFLIIRRVIIDSVISSPHLPPIRSWMVWNWQLHCRDFENLDFAKYLADSSVLFGDFENLDNSKYLNAAKQCFIKIQTFCRTIG